MHAVERVLSRLPKYRCIGDGKYRAPCPVHRGKSDYSLSIKDAGDRVLMYCFAGCSLYSILGALGMQSASELFDRVQGRHPDPVVQRRRQAERDLQRWAEGYLNIVCQFLREIDSAIRFGSSVLTMYEDGRLSRNPEVEEEFWSSLSRAYKLRTEYEWEFEILNGKDAQAKLDLWREVSR